MSGSPPPQPETPAIEPPAAPAGENRPESKQSARFSGLAMRLAIVGIGCTIGFPLYAFLNANAPPPKKRTVADDAPPPPEIKLPEADEFADVLVPPIQLSGEYAIPISFQQEMTVEDAVANLLIAGENRVSYVDFASDVFDHDDRAIFEPHGEEVCASGCAASRHPTEKLTEQEYNRLIRAFANEPISENSQAYEALLYYGRQTRDMLNRLGSGPLDDLRVAALRKELKRTHVFVQLRVLDEKGEVRSWLPSTRVPLDRRHVFDMEVNRVQPLITSGTVKRVGLYHLWTRL